jgi:hypothetical protein
MQLVAEQNSVHLYYLYRQYQAQVDGIKMPNIYKPGEKEHIGYYHWAGTLPTASPIHSANIPDTNMPYEIIVSSDKTKDGMKIAMLCLRVKNVMKLDWDDLSIEYVGSLLESYCFEHPGALFYLYQTTKGFHAVLVSDLMPHDSDSRTALSHELKNDINYSAMCFHRGYTFRFSRKATRPDEEHIVKFLRAVGTGKPHQDIAKFLEFYHSLVEKGLQLPTDWNKRIIEAKTLEDISDACGVAF